MEISQSLSESKPRPTEKAMTVFVFRSIIISFYIYNIIRVRWFSRGGFNVLHFLSEQNDTQKQNASEPFLIKKIFRVPV